MQSTPTLPDAGYSPPLTIDLTLHGEQYEVAAIGPDAVTLRHPRTAPPGHGVVCVSIDGRPILYHVDLFDGIDPDRKKQAFRHLGVAAEVAA